MSFGTIPADPLAGTGLDQFPRPGENTRPTGSYIDVSLEAPAVQFQALVQMLEANDAANPAPFTSTPPWQESTDPADNIVPGILDEHYLPAADMEAAATADILAEVRDPYWNEIATPDWYNDDQYHGLGVPPGVPNWDQPIESGHTQITVLDPSAEHGWDAWSGRTAMARVARMQNNFPQYNISQSRGHGVVPEKLTMPYVLLTQQYRDLLLAELKARGVHNIVVDQVPSVPYTEQVTPIDPSVLAPEAPIGPEGVLPW